MTEPAAGPVPAADIPPLAEVRPHDPRMVEVSTSITLDLLEALLDARGIVTRRAQVPEGAYLKFNVGSFKALILPYGNSPDFSSLAPVPHRLQGPTRPTGREPAEPPCS